MPRNNSRERRNERRQSAVDRMRQAVEDGRNRRRGRNDSFTLAEADRVEQLVVRDRRGWTE